MNRIDFFAKMLNERGAKVGVEVGVALGGFSFPLLDRCPGLTMYMVDPWKETKEGQERIPLDEQENRHVYVVNEARRFKGRAKPWRTTSADAALQWMGDDHLDFLYLDGDHSYEGVRQDLHDWYGHAFRDCLIAGHDYLQGNVGGVEYGVKLAVDEFAEENGLKVGVVQEDWPSFWLDKP